jgi:hypothetical protein
LLLLLCNCSIAGNTTSSGEDWGKKREQYANTDDGDKPTHCEGGFALLLIKFAPISLSPVISITTLNTLHFGLPLTLLSVSQQQVENTLQSHV